MRQDGQIVKVPIAWKSIEVPFRGGLRHAMTVPWGDVASAWHTTGIGNIEVYTALPRKQIRRLRSVRWAFCLLKFRPIRALAGRVMMPFVKGPTPEQRKTGSASFWGRVTDAEGNSVEATLETPGGYRLTAATALASLERISSDGIPPGFSTPARAFGPEFILSCFAEAGALRFR